MLNDQRDSVKYSLKGRYIREKKKKKKKENNNNKKKNSFLKYAYSVLMHKHIKITDILKHLTTHFSRKTWMFPFHPLFNLKISCIKGSHAEQVDIIKYS